VKDRNATIFAAIMSGDTLGVVAAQHGVSFQRVYQIVRRELEANHRDVLEQWGDGTPPLAWLRKVVKS
jgi:Mor family transcriptional regulator